MMYLGCGTREFTTDLGHHCMVTDDGRVWDYKLNKWANIAYDGVYPSVLLRRPYKKLSLPLLMLQQFKPFERTDEECAVTLNGDCRDMNIYNLMWSHVRGEYVIGNVYNRLIVLSTFSYTGKTFCECQCSCGKLVPVDLSKLRSGHTKSCGCFKIEEFTERVSTHKLSNHPLYNILSDMHRRCDNPNRSHYHRYGGRGILVCPEWSIDNVINFIQWSESNGWYEDCGLEIDRIDNDGNYEPSNCRWTTSKVNSRNSTRVNNLTHEGDTMCLTAWEDKLDIPRGRISGRLQRGCTTKEALTQGRLSRRF